MAGASFKLENLVALIDCNGIQADGRVVLDMEPVAEKWRAFGWRTQEIDGNDLGAVVAALGEARAALGRPQAIVLRTLPGKGVPTLEQREKAHFIRVDSGEWDDLAAELEREAVAR
jgi:transketolase